MVNKLQSLFRATTEPPFSPWNATAAHNQARFFQMEFHLLSVVSSQQSVNTWNVRKLRHSHSDEMKSFPFQLKSLPKRVKIKRNERRGRRRRKHIWFRFACTAPSQTNWLWRIVRNIWMNAVQFICFTYLIYVFKWNSSSVYFWPAYHWLYLQRQQESEGDEWRDEMNSKWIRSRVRVRGWLSWPRQ